MQTAMVILWATQRTVPHAKTQALQKKKISAPDGARSVVLQTQAVESLPI